MDREFVADAVVHVLGLVLGTLGSILLLTFSLSSSAPAQWPPFAVYVVGAMAMLGCSALHNLWRSASRRHLLRRLDHAAIFLMIAGTYTPITTLGLADPWGTRLTVIVWSAAAVGMVVKLWQPRRVETVSVALYLLLGWIGLIALEPLLASMDKETLVMLLVGGVIYSGGVVFHLSDRRRYHRALWHACVLTGAAVHYLAIMTVMQA